MILPLQIRQGAAGDGSPAAWFLPGDSTERWLEELARCGLAGAETRLYAVPRSRADRSPAGLLVVPVNSKTPVQSPSGVACRLLAGRLFVPMEAALQPPDTDVEVRALCPLPVAFLHPTLGLSGFDEGSTLRVWDLIDAPEERAGQWNCAQPGAAPLPKLTALLLAQPPSFEDLFGGAEQEIGSEPPVDLPPTPDEPQAGALSDSQRSLKRLFAKSMADALRKLPHQGQRRTWVNKLEDWANLQLSGVNEQLEKLRHKDIHRLLHLFESDPEEGLRHAIPMNNFGHRGVAPPVGRLGEHGTDFDPHRLGGRPADRWNVPPDLQEILRLRYREMADREMQLGRHRRAAYIYAELLGDLVSAAHALKQGRLFREAALIYEEHLRNPLEAARCLAGGGLLAEASERYEKLGRWLEVADLQERLGNTAAAQAALRQVVNEHLGRHDFIGASKLLEERLRAPDEAVELLAGAWPGSAQAGGSVSALFQLLARLGRHDAAQERLARIVRVPVPTSLTLPLLTALSGPVQGYPHAPVRQRAADFSRVLVARQLSRTSLSTDEAGRLMECLTRLAPQDRLLARDANRHLAACRDNQLRAQRMNPPPTQGGKPFVLHRFELPRQIQWLHLRTAGHWFFAAGVTANHLTMVRGTWDGELQSLSWTCPAEAARNGLVFELAGDDAGAVAVATLSGPPLARKCFPAADLFFGQECTVETPTWLPPQWDFRLPSAATWSGRCMWRRAGRLFRATTGMGTSSARST